MRGFCTLVALVAILFVSLGWGWSFTNVATSIGDKLMQSRPEESRVLNFDGSNSTSANKTADVTVQGRIIMVPRRSNGRCQPDEQVDRRGKCRTVW
ncbi:hypothetical protein EAI_07039 [Harpegnathos saltator]|uniref:Uncharacterized protein n=1 Tax=Harpegnathos saltator TaxID=610380 RepID=E2BVE4_HARSA|nr:hypothetical protein EAI_07039 [Harpegnathos saltator]